MEYLKMFENLGEWILEYPELGGTHGDHQLLEVE